MKTLSTILAELEQVAEAATPGPWEFVNRPDNQLVTSGNIEICALPGIWAHTEDFKFIASSRTTNPLLVKALRRAMDYLKEDYGDTQAFRYVESDITAILNGDGKDLGEKEPHPQR